MVPAICCSPQPRDLKEQDSTQACASDCRPFASVSLVVECCGHSPPPGFQTRHGPGSVRSRHSELQSTPRELDPVPLDALVANTDGIVQKGELLPCPQEPEELTDSPKASGTDIGEGSPSPSPSASASASAGVGMDPFMDAHTKVSVLVAAASETAHDPGAGTNTKVSLVASIGSESPWTTLEKVKEVPKEIDYENADLDDLDIEELPIIDASTHAGYFTFDPDDLIHRRDHIGIEDGKYRSSGDESIARSSTVTASQTAGSVSSQQTGSMQYSPPQSRRVSQNTQGSKGTAVSKGRTPRASKLSKGSMKSWRWSLRSGASWRLGGDMAQVPLKDMLLIVIGNGAEAELLARRRFQAGGRVCLLWTDRPPRNDARYPLLPPGNCGSSDFFWKPPEIGYPDALDPEIKRLQGSLGTGIVREYFKVGPDIIPLAKFQRYDMITGKSGQRVGIRVWDRGRVKASSRLICERIRWEVSGAVVFAGKMGPSLPVTNGSYENGSCEIGKDCFDSVDIHGAGEFDVSTCCEHTLPLLRVQPLTMLLWSLYNLLCYFIFHLLMVEHETSHELPELLWWRAVLALTLSLPFGCSIGPHFLGYALVGHTGSILFETFGVLIAILTFGSVLLAPMGEEDGRRNQVSLSGGIVLGMLGYLLIMLPAHLIWCWLGIRTMPLRLCRHAAWTLWLLMVIFGGWALMYVIAVGYLSIAQDWQILGGLLLPLACCGFEGFTSLVTSRVYYECIHRTRIRPEGLYDIRGDQKLPYMGVIVIAHSYAESMRMVCLLVHALEQQTYVWIVSLALGIAVNLLSRRGWISSLICRACPDNLMTLMMPTATSKVCDHAKISFGFLRFIGPLALGIARTAGRGEAPFFGSSGLEVLIVMLVAEILEDLLLYLEFIPYAQPTEREREVYTDLSPFDPAQVFARSKDDPFIFRGLLLHGIRPVGAREVGGFVSISTLISVCLLEFFLGPGYAYGVCQEQLPAGQRVANSFIRQTPLICK